MPRISAFRGMAIYMYFDDHAPPHFHVRAGGADARVVIRSGSVDGSLAGGQHAAVDLWRRQHTLELLQNWARAARHEPLHQIEPLR